MLEDVSLRGGIPAHCFYCEEPIRYEDPSEQLASGQRLHMECLFRSVSGSVAHVQRRCSCYIPGSTEDDPPGMTPRQAARAAVDAYKCKTFADVLNCDGACPMCGGFDFHLGPRGGLARNIKCAGCGAKFFYCPPLEPALIWNEDAAYHTAESVRLPKGEPLPMEPPRCGELPQ